MVNPLILVVKMVYMEYNYNTTISVLKLPISQISQIKWPNGCLIYKNNKYIKYINKFIFSIYIFINLYI